MNGRMKRYEDMTPEEKALADGVLDRMNKAMREALKDYEARKAMLREGAEQALKEAGLWIEEPDAPAIVGGTD